MSPFSVGAIGSAFTYLQLFWECATPPHVHPTSRQVIACDQFYQAFPALVLQVTNAGVRRSGYETIDKGQEPFCAGRLHLVRFEHYTYTPPPYMSFHIKDM